MKRKSMTPTQREKFLRSYEFLAACTQAEYPYGFDYESEKASLVEDRRRSLRAQWEAIYSAATGEGWNTPEGEPKFHRACGGETNADDTAREGRFQRESAEYYSCAIASYDSLASEYPEFEPETEEVVSADSAIPADMPITDILCLPVFNPNGIFHEKAALIAQRLCFEPYAVLRGKLEKLAAELSA